MPTPIDCEQVQQLLREGAQLVEVLPRAEYEDEHLPGAITLDYLWTWPRSRPLD